MEKWIGDLLIDLSPPERAKFKAPLILVHGLWSSSRCWDSWATHFSNLGWECWAVNFRGRFGADAGRALKRLSFDDCVADLKRVVRAAPAPPVVLAHDLGGLIALKAVANEKAAALALAAPVPPKNIAPELPRALQLLRLKYRPLVFLRRSFRLEEKDFTRLWLAPDSERGAAAPPGCLVADAHRLIAEFFARGAALDPGAVACPVLVAAAGEDRVAPLAALRRFAQWLGADFRAFAGRGHWLIGAAGGEEAVREVHRWIVQKAGAEMLLEEAGGPLPEPTD
ncbi:MAG TPA: alpha/beta fold hydrolase [Candidatus Binatia bacterium]